MQAALNFPPELLIKAQGIKLAFFDVDGVLTDGGLIFSEQGESLKRFNTLDGHGLKMLKKAGITPAVISGRDSLPLRVRLQALGIEHVFFGTEDKLPVADQTRKRLGLDWHECAAMGDDWPDLPVLTHCAFACAPPGAHVEVLTRAHYVTRSQAGQGAAREFCDLLMVASGRYVDLLGQYDR